MEATQKSVFDDFEEGSISKEGADELAKEMIEIGQEISADGRPNLETILCTTLEILMQDRDLEKVDEIDMERSMREQLGFALLTGVAIGLRFAKRAGATSQATD